MAGNVRLKIDHSEKQREYVQWKYEELASCVPSRPARIDYYDKRTGNTYCNRRFATHSLPDFDYYWGLFYRSGRKIIPINIGQILHSPISLAVWHMDDGYV